MTPPHKVLKYGNAATSLQYITAPPTFLAFVRNDRVMRLNVKEILDGLRRKKRSK